MRPLSAWEDLGTSLSFDRGVRNVRAGGAASRAELRGLGRRRTLPAAPPRGLGIGLAVALLVTAVGFGFTHGDKYRGLISGAGGIGNASARLVGLSVSSVVINGLSELDAREALAAAGIDKSASLPFFNSGEAKARLESLPLVQSASVRKLYPDRVVIDIVERTPSGIWQKDGELHTIATDGAVIDQLKSARFADLPFVVGAGANLRVEEYRRIFRSLEELSARVAAGVLVDERRWDLKMTSGVLVKLPESNPAFAASELVELERRERVLDRDVTVVDLRSPDRIFARLAEGATLPEREGKAKKGGQP